MKIGIIGLPQTGKKTFFQALTNHPLAEKDLISGKPIKAVAEIKDPRFDLLVSMYNPKKQVRARVDIELLPKIEKDSFSQDGIFKDIAELNAICHVVRCFQDESVYHVAGSVDPQRDIDNINSEILLHDMLFIEKRLERIEKGLKKLKDEKAAKEKDLLEKLKQHLDKGLPIRVLGLGKEERAIISSYPFLTMKKMLIVLNISEKELSSDILCRDMQKRYEGSDIYLMSACAKVESEIASFESEQERIQYLSALGISSPAVYVLTTLCIKALDLISFFTVGPDEVRQWTIPFGSYAPQAAGAIHTDLENGFIRAEVIKYNDLISLGSEIKAKEAGKAYLKGKDYIVEDGDILEIRFNV
ncbi:MAG: redox-regulated ATPase YchF [Candidatus Omnitrophica bacterium]|nr:redox-regulated ATPase YchF [Candidatus Omnitrophota bacterium]